MVYSVFSWSDGLYHYYQSPEPSHFGVRPVPVKRVNQPRGPGHKLEDLLPVVPIGSKPVGAGTVARGRVAVLERDKGRGLGADAATSDSKLNWWVIAAAAGFLFVSYQVAIAVGKRAG
jgi:hypothetical protein